MIGLGGIDPLRFAGQALGIVGQDQTSTDAPGGRRRKTDPTAAAGEEATDCAARLKALRDDWRQEANESSREDDNYADGYAAGLRKAADDLAKEARKAGF